MRRWSEVRNGELVYFVGKTGSGSVVKTEFHGRYFMPAKIGMRIKGEKKPIVKWEKFVFNSSRVQKAEGTDRIVKCFLTRESDSTVVAISEKQFMQYFCKNDIAI